jgi:hypothetical protein
VTLIKYNNCAGVLVICVRVLYCWYCVFVLFRLCIFILICFVSTSARTAATKWTRNCCNNNNNNNKQKISSNRHYTTFVNKKTTNTFLIDIAVPNTHNLVKTITNRQNEYQELANEICAMWMQNAAQVIPIVISATGVIPKSLSQSLKRLNLHPNTYIKMQKSVILGTCSIVRNFLKYK